MQSLALDSRTPVESLVRHALAAATKLDDQDTRLWASKELNGYRIPKELPEYRVVLGMLKAWNPFTSQWIPVDYPDEEVMKMMKSVHLVYPIGEISRLSTTEGTIQLDVDDMFMDLFRKTPHFKAGIVPSQIIGQTSLHGVTEIVRTRVLEWSLALEKEGVLGEGLTFTGQEKKAASNMVFNIFDGAQLNQVVAQHSNQVAVSTGDGSSSVEA